MKRPAALLVLMLLALTGLGCRFPWESRSGSVVGTVRYTDGTPVYMARVQIEGGAATFTDGQGHYALIVDAPPGTAVRVLARDGYTPGRSYAETHFGEASLVARQATDRRDIALDHSTPI